MLTEDDLRAVLNEWADAAIDAEGADVRPQRRPRRWLAPLAAAAAVAAAALTITVVTDRDPVTNTVSEPAPTHSDVLQPAHAPNLSTFTPKWMTDNLRRFLPRGTVSNVTGGWEKTSAYVAFDYDDGHGVAGLRVWVQVPTPGSLAKTGGGCDSKEIDMVSNTERCTLGQLAAPKLQCVGNTDRRPPFCGGIFSGGSSGSNGVRSWIASDFSTHDIVVQLELQNAPLNPTTKTIRTSRLLTDSQLNTIATDPSWSERAR